MVKDVYLAVPDPDALGLGEDDGEGVVANKQRDTQMKAFLISYICL